MKIKDEFTRPLERAADKFFNAAFGSHLSTGTFHPIVDELADKLETLKQEAATVRRSRARLAMGYKKFRKVRRIYDYL